MSAEALHARWTLDAGNHEHVVFVAEGIHCAGCVRSIERAVGALAGVETVRVNSATARVSVDWRGGGSTGLTQILRAVEKAGFRPVPLAGSTATLEYQRERRTALKRFGLASFGMMQAMMYLGALYGAHAFGRPRCALPAHGHGDAQHHGCACVAGGTERAGQHEEQHHPAAEQKHDAKERQCLGLHGGSGVHDAEQPGRQHVPERRQDEHRHSRRDEKCLVDGAVDPLYVTRTGKARDQHAHPGEHRVHEYDDDDEDLNRHADRRVAGVADEIAHQCVIDHPLHAADHVLDHRRPRDHPDGAGERTVDNRAVELFRGAGRGRGGGHAHRILIQRRSDEAAVGYCGGRLLRRARKCLTA